MSTLGFSGAGCAGASRASFAALLALNCDIKSDKVKCGINNYPSCHHLNFSVFFFKT